MSAAKALQQIGHYSDDSDRRIRAYLAAVVPLRGNSFGNDGSYHRGRCLIERMANSATGYSLPTVRLSIDDCADVLNFVRRSEPLDEATWAVEPEDAPSHICGLHLVLEAVETALRSRRPAPH